MGTVDKFVGDAVLAVFGTPESKPDDAQRAVQAALSVCQAVREWHDRRKQEGIPAALVGVGAHHGEVFAGVIVSGNILEHSIIGDAVNIAQRLERLTRDLDADVILSDDLVAAAETKVTQLGLVRKKDVKIRGHSAPITIYHNTMSDH
jgi:adenylate cyclase